MPHPALVDDFIDEILERVAGGQGISAAIAGLGIGPTMFYRRLHDKPELARRYQEAVAVRGQHKAEQYRAKAHEIALADGHPKQWDALKASLEAHAPEFSKRTVVEHTGTVETEFAGMSTEDLERLVATLTRSQPQLDGEIVDAEVVETA